MIETSDPDLWADIHCPRSEYEKPSPGLEERIPIGPAPGWWIHVDTTATYLDPETGEEMVNVTVNAEKSATEEDWGPDAETDFGSMGEIFTEDSDSRRCGVVVLPMAFRPNADS